MEDRPIAFLDRIPVGRAQFRERGTGLRQGAIALGDDPAPVGFRKIGSGWMLGDGEARNA